VEFGLLREKINTREKHPLFSFFALLLHFGDESWFLSWDTWLRTILNNNKNAYDLLSLGPSTYLISIEKETFPLLLSLARALSFFLSPEVAMREKKPTSRKGLETHHYFGPTREHTRSDAVIK